VAMRPNGGSGTVALGAETVGTGTGTVGTGVGTVGTGAGAVGTRAETVGGGDESIGVAVEVLEAPGGSDGSGGEELAAAMAAFFGGLMIDLSGAQLSYRDMIVTETQVRLSLSLRVVSFPSPNAEI